MLHDCYEPNCIFPQQSIATEHTMDLVEDPSFGTLI